MNWKSFIIRAAISLIVAGGVQLWKQIWWISIVVGFILLAILIIENFVRKKKSKSKKSILLKIIKLQGIENWYENHAATAEKILYETRKSKTIDLMLIRGHDWILGDNPLLNKILIHHDLSFQDPIRLVILNPKSKYMEQYLKGQKLTSEQKREYLQKCQLAKTRLDDFQRERKINYSYYNFQPIWKLIITKYKLFLACYQFDIRGRDLQIFEYGEGPLYYSFSKYFDSMWDVIIQKMRPSP